MNGVHYNTNAKTKKFSNGKDKSAVIDQEVFRVGMVVTVRYSPGDNNAQEIVYRNNLLGPVSAVRPGENTIEVLGQTVVVGNGALSPGDVVEVSGFVDSAGRIRATYIEQITPPTRPAEGYEVKGFVSGLSTSDNTFLLGQLPDGSGVTVTVSYGPAAIADLPGGLENGMYVQVTTVDTAPSRGRITGTLVERLPPRTDFPENAVVDLEGLVTAATGGSGNVLSFAVEGKRVRTNDATDFTGHSPAEIQPDTKLLVRGTETGGGIEAVNIIFR
jgi:hypothetical protein